MTRTVQLHRATLHLGDSLDVLKTLAPESVDSIVCDPPYDLIGAGKGGFMGKEWDATGVAFRPATWTEALRVLKPGGHLLAFGGSRTYHRLACAVEDAGFEIRDQIMWVYSSGFPKSFNLDRLGGEIICNCDGGALPSTHDEETKQTPERDMHSLPDAHVPQAVDSRQGRREVLQPSLSQQGLSSHGEACRTSLHEGAEQSGLEGRRDLSEATGKLCAGEVCQGTGMGLVDGPQGRLCDGAPTGDGEADRQNADARGNRASHGPQAAKQRAIQSRALAGQPESQTRGAWPICRGCLLPRVPRGLGSALKPAHEPIVMARKPLDGTIAQNVLGHGTGALNIDGCRVPTDETRRAGSCGLFSHIRDGKPYPQVQEANEIAAPRRDRWPANLIHDGSVEVLAAFPDAPGQSGAVTDSEPSSKTNNVYGQFDGRPATQPRGDAGSAARFFYCAKASRKDRDEGLERFEARPAGVKNESGRGFADGDPYRAILRKNTHPTVKPSELMRYLCRLVTQPGGTVLDPFLGSGSTGKAALLEGFRFIGIEREPEYFEIALARVAGGEAVPSEAETVTLPQPKPERPVQPDLFGGAA